jgi:hypothetical protein
MALWLATRISRRPAELLNLAELWTEWSGATVPALTTPILLTDRDDAASVIIKWLQGTPSVLSLQAETADEALAFLYAAIARWPEDQQMLWISR